VHVPRKSQHSKRQHLLRMSVTVAIVGVALFIILAKSAPLYRWLPGLTPAPSAPANTSILPGGDSFYIDASPLWGRLSIDGNRSNMHLFGGKMHLCDSPQVNIILSGRLSRFSRYTALYRCL
jgi:hypothetical protein